MAEHGVDYMYILAPHTVSDVDDPKEAYHKDDIGDENRQQGFHRLINYIRCECGEEFTGNRVSEDDYREHLPDDHPHKEKDSITNE